MPSILLYGAAGHTARFIIDSLLESGFTPLLGGRDRDKLEAASASHGGLEVRVAAADDPAALDRALAGAAAVINAAGPFAATAAPLVEAAQRARVPYLDIAAEPDVVAATIAAHDAPARKAGIALAPALGFYGGLGDLLATAALGDWPEADKIALAFSLSSWIPTQGTRTTIEVADRRRAGRRLVYTNQGLQLRDDDAPQQDWLFPAPIGRQRVTAEFATADALTMSRHLKTAAIAGYMTLAPLKDLGEPDLSRLRAVDARGRSAQTFLVEAVVRSGTNTRRAVARGQDIYAVTGPLVVEALRRLLAQPGRWYGVVSAGQLGDARSYLEALAPEHLTFTIDAG